MTDDSRLFWSFICTLVALVVLAKLGSADIAVSTALIGVLGMLARPGRATPSQLPTDVTVTNGTDKPIPTKEEG